MFSLTNAELHCYFFKRPIKYYYFLVGLLQIKQQNMKSCFALQLFIFIRAIWYVTSDRKTCSNLALPKAPLLPLNCTHYNLTGQRCSNYINVYLRNYAGLSQTPSEIYDVPTQGYSPALPAQDSIFFPVEYFNVNKQTNSKANTFANSTSTTLQVVVALQFLKMFGIDDISASLKSTIIFTVAWFDDRLTWNSTLTPFAYNYCEKSSEEAASVYFIANGIQTLSENVWTPDLTLLNSASDNANMVTNMAGSRNVELYPNGLIKWRLTGTVEAFCELDLRWFPFDTQTCSILFSSRSNYIIDGINFTLPTKNTPINASLNPSLFSSEFVDSISWTTKSITASRIEKILFGNANSFQNAQSVLAFTAVLQRHPKTFIITAILPNVLVTSLSIASLWIADHPTRLAVTVTALLTIVAVLVSIHILAYLSM